MDSYPTPPMTSATLTVVQFSDMIAMMQVGWVKGPAGRLCECGGPIWIKDVGGWERHRCSYCGASKDYRTT